MRNATLLLAVIISLAFFACSKSKDSSPENSSALKFDSLNASDTVMKVNALTIITAVASGEGLSYTWTATYGTFIGSGSRVQWTVCHSDKFTVSCEVKDKNNNSQMKTVTIRTIE